MNHKVAFAFLAVAFSSSVSSAVLAGEPGGRRFSDTQLLTSLPTPGFPEGIVVEGTTAYVSGPATFGTAGQGPSPIHAIDTRTGEQLGSLYIEGEDLSQEHALSSMTSDGEGRLYVLSTQLGVIRIDPNTGEQEIYATIPHLQACNELPPGPCVPSPGSACLEDAPSVSCGSGRCLPPGPCAPGESCLPPGPCQPVAFDRGSLPNDLAFDDEGNLYITDSFQATIFRVTPGGGVAEAYYQDPAFDTSAIPGFALGFNGIRVSPDRAHIYFTQSFGANAGVWKLPRISPSAPSYTLQLVKAYNNFEVPDGLAFGRTGRLYVALAGVNKVGCLMSWGWEFTRFPSTSVNETLEMPYDAPANLAFNGRGSLLVVNHALFTGPSHAAVLDAVVFDTESPLAKPILQ